MAVEDFLVDQDIDILSDWQKTDSQSMDYPIGRP